MYRNLLLALHIASAGAWLGANLVQILLSPRYDKGPTAESALWTRQTIWLGERFYPTAGALLAITGVLLVIETPWDWSDPFVGVGIAVVIIGATLGAAFFGPVAKRRAEALEAGDTRSATATLRRIVPVALLDTALILLAVLAMVDKWGV